jgi:hypothetical protein
MQQSQENQTERFSNDPRAGGNAGLVSGMAESMGALCRAAGSGCALARRTPSIGPARPIGDVVAALEKAWSEFVESMWRIVARIG